MFILADVISTSVHSGRCVFRQAYILADVTSDKCDLWKMLILKNVILEGDFLGSVFLRGKRIPHKTTRN